MSNTMNEYPNFFKVFLPEKHSDRMLIPVAFVKLMISKQNVLRDYIFRDQRGRDWKVKARPIDGKLYFDDGWKRFKDENSLEQNDFIVFTHIENNVFKIKILELSSRCEKIKLMDGEENNDDMREVGVGHDDDDNVVDDDDDDDYDYDDEGDDEVSRNEYQHCRICKSWGIGSSSTVRKLDVDEIDAEMYIQPGNPYFFPKYYHYRPNELHIPKKVVKDFCLCFTKHVNLVCCNCKDIESNEIASYHETLPTMTTKHRKKRGEIRIWKNGRVFALGWANFCAKYKIKESDSCLCEIVLHEEKEIKMIRVHVIRKIMKE
ncbi:unnamed protein product [Lathyrus sativus]|nr:unnamed protein product [Lathyrus sativus]